MSRRSKRITASIRGVTTGIKTGYSSSVKGSTVRAVKNLNKAINILGKINTPVSKAKDPYYDFSDVIRGRALAGNKHELAKMVASESKRLNQRFYRLEKAGKGINDTAYLFAKGETGKEKPRYTTNVKKLEEMDIAEITEIGLQVNAKLKSRTSTIRGLEEVEDNRINAAIASLKDNFGIELNKDEYIEFINSGGYEMLNSSYLDSVQVIKDWQMWKDEGITIKQFVNRYNEVLNAKRETTREQARTRANKTFRRLSNN